MSAGLGVVELMPQGFSEECGAFLFTCIFPSWSLRGSECPYYHCLMKLALGNREGQKHSYITSRAVNVLIIVGRSDGPAQKTRGWQRTSVEGFGLSLQEELEVWGRSGHGGCFSDFGS